MRVKAPNGLVFDMPDAIATGLVGGRNQKWEHAPAEVAAAQPAAPKPNASKADWVKFAVTRGVPQEEAEASSKNDLIKRLT